MKFTIELTDADIRNAATLDALRALLGRDTAPSDVVVVPVLDLPMREERPATGPTVDAAAARRRQGHKLAAPLTRSEIDGALGDCGGNRSAAAKFLGVTLPTLYRAMRRLGGYATENSPNLIAARAALAASRAAPPRGRDQDREAAHG